ncbi:MAG: hypothetical protein HYT82_01230 [Candidatus Harrisonbacteria bacterium]|nr:hypothetical protein [Candidatus Harrisonbacteria bacterium]
MRGTITYEEVSLLANAAEEFVYLAFFHEDRSPTIFNCASNAWLGHKNAEHLRTYNRLLTPDGQRVLGTMFRVAGHLLRFGESGGSRTTSYGIAEFTCKKPHAKPVAMALQCLDWALANSLATRNDTSATTASHNA